MLINLLSRILYDATNSRRGSSNAITMVMLCIVMTLHGTSAFHNPVFYKIGKVSTLTSNTAIGMRVAYQGEPGAYSEKSTRELLGPSVVAVGRPDFESCFQAVASMECDYACLPVENSLGGSIHENYA